MRLNLHEIMMLFVVRCRWRRRSFQSAADPEIQATSMTTKRKRWESQALRNVLKSLLIFNDILCELKTREFTGFSLKDDSKSDYPL